MPLKIRHLPLHSTSVRGGGRMMARRCTRSALAGAALALFIALAGWLLPEATPAEATSFAADSVTIISSAGPDNTYGTGDIITLRVAFRVHFVTGHSGGALAIDVGGTTRSATPTIASGCSRNVDFSYRVVGGDRDTDGITVAANALSGTWTTNHHVSDCTLPAGIHTHPSPSIVAALTTPQASHKVDAPFTDYDTDDDNLIDVTTLAQLNAIRHDLNGNGDPTAGVGATAYNTAFPDREDRATGRMGCAATCAGYELLNNLDFDTDGSGSVDSSDDYPNWTPIGTQAAPFIATFDGNGHTIANLSINASGIADVGLFGVVSGGTIAGVGLNGINIAASHTSSTPLTYLRAGGLSGYITSSTVRGSYATGEITTTASDMVLSQVGGLAGHVTTSSSIAASYAAVAVTANSTTPAATGIGSADLVGGLVGVLAGTASTRSSMTAAYATGAVEADRGGARVGGLIGVALQADVSASYATGTVTGPTAPTNGLIGGIETGATVTASYWDTTTSGIPDDGDDDPPEGKNTRELKSPTRYTGIYANWNVNVDGESGNDDPWDFGAAFQYPVLKYGGQDIYRQGRVLPAEPAEPEAPAEAPPIIYNLNIRFDARRIALPEGHQATYRVRLAGQPAGRGSNIRIRSDNPDVQPTPDALLFTAANWNQWQTVAISIAGDANHTDESATLAHYGPNRGYGSVLVSVTDTGDSRQAGDTTPPALTVITEPGARWGVTVAPTVPADLAADGVVRVSSAYRLPRTATGYNLGRSGAAQAIVSIAAPDDVPASGLTVCLPVARALADEAGERPLTLLRYAAAADDGAADDGAAWQPVSGAEHNAATRSVCAAGLTGFGPFAAAYALPQ